MKILLVNPPVDLDRIFGAGKVFVQKYRPLGLLYIAAVAREAGFDVSVIDALAEEMSEGELKKKTAELNPDVVGISTLTSSGSAVWRYGGWLKKNFKDTCVVLGNVHASVFAQEYLRNSCCDAVVHGEGENIFPEIAKKVAEKGSFETVRGITFRNEKGEIIRTGAAAAQEISSFPFPARDLLLHGLYNLGKLSNRYFVGGKGAITETMISSRGCPRRCTFCAVHGSRSPRFSDPARVVDEMEMLKREYGASYILLEDALFLANGPRVLEICSLIGKRGFKLGWGCQGHVQCVTREIIKAMDKAGCYEISLGIESGVQSILDRINKGTTLEGIREAIRIIKDNSDIHVEGLFVLGLPGERYEESLKTIEFAKSLPLDMAQFSVLTPYPGSPLFDELRMKGEIDSGVREDGSVDPAVWDRYASYICFSNVAPVWITDAFDADSLRKLQKKALRDFYLRPAHILRHLRRINPGNFAEAFRIAVKGFF